MATMHRLLRNIKHFSIVRTWILLIILVVISSCDLGGVITRHQTLVSTLAHQGVANSKRGLPNNNNDEIGRILLHKRVSRYSSSSAPRNTSNSNSNGATRRRRVFHAKLSDVWLCLACALGWTVWIVTSFQRPEYKKFGTIGKLIRGHVLQSTIETDVDGTNIPSYRAVIDYVVHQDHPDPDGDDDEESLHIRKSFQTHRFLPEGFANVELLVLPHDPMSAVVREDWERDLAEREQERTEWRRFFTWMLRIVAVALVCASVGGALHAVLRLRYSSRLWGWISVAVAVTLMWPAAVWLHQSAIGLSRIFHPPSESAGTVIKGDLQQYLQRRRRRLLRLSCRNRDVVGCEPLEVLRAEYEVELRKRPLQPDDNDDDNKSGNPSTPKASNKRNAPFTSSFFRAPSLSLSPRVLFSTATTRPTTSIEDEGYSVQFVQSQRGSAGISKSESISTLSSSCSAPGSGSPHASVENCKSKSDVTSA